MQVPVIAYTMGLYRNAWGSVGMDHCFSLSGGNFPVADPDGGLGGLNPPFRGFFFCLSVYENSHGPGP